MKTDIYESIRNAIRKHVAPLEVLGDIWPQKDKWRAIVAASTTGPMMLMEFGVTLTCHDEVIGQTGLQ
jgi:hypothetical protein